jgi:outer membrane receptor protein involved in Fe transport
VRRGSDTVNAAGTAPKEDGTFHIDGLTPGTYTVRFRGLGFAPIARAGVVITANAPSVDIGTLKLNPVATKLEGQQVVAEREETVVSPDRTSYSTKNMTVASGGNAVDVLKNIPLVEVDGTNKVSLRGNENVTIQINGRPTPLKGDQLASFLAQLPANTVKTVEVATNPSAKDDPEGTAGIINIVLNQEAELGLSGGVTAGTSTTGLVNTNGNIGKQQGKITAFFSAGIYRDRRAMGGTVSRTNLAVPTPAFVEQSVDGRNKPFSGNANLRGEYRLDNIRSISLDSYGWAGRYSTENTSNFTDLDASHEVIGLFDQSTLNLSTNYGGEADITFRRQNQPTDPSLTAEIDAYISKNLTKVDLASTLTQADATMPAASPVERDTTRGVWKGVFTKVDYSHPFSTTSKLEGGYKGNARSMTNDFTASYLDAATGAFEDAAGRSSGFSYNEVIGSVWGLMSQRVNKVQLQAGVRLEDALTHFDVRPLDQRFDRTYASVYPSAIASYNFTDMRSMKLSYSRRVSRPNPWQLSPVEQRNDARSVYRGNPNLRAEYTDAVELGYQETLPFGSLSASTYMRHTGHGVRNINFVDSTGLSVNTFDNVSSITTAGSDLSLMLRKDGLTSNISGSAYHFSSDASNLSGNLSAHDIVWSARTNTTYKFTDRFDVQGNASYRAPYRMEGGSQLASVGMNFGMRYKAWGDQGNVSIRVSDPFALSKYGYRTANGTVVEFAQRVYQQRALYLTVSRNVGQELKLKPKEADSQGSGGTP